MSEATIISNNTPNPDKKSKTPSIETLTKRKEFLENKLKAVQDILEEKQRAKAEKEREKSEKDRTRALILLGLYYLEQYKNMTKPFTSEELINSINRTCTEIENFYQHKINNVSERKKTKFKAEANLLIEFIKKEIIQEVHQLEDQTPQE